MILLKNLIREILLKELTFKQLYDGSEEGRKQRGKDDVKRQKNTAITATDLGEAWSFSYKSNPSTTGNRWHGFIQFLKESVENNDDPMKIDCMVNCDCPDFRYRYAYNDSNVDASWLGKDPRWKYSNGNNGQKWRSRSEGGVGDYGVGLCKHLCSLHRFLEYIVTDKAPEPDDAGPTIKNKEEPEIEKPSSLSQQSQMAPEPEDTYSDSRTGSDTLDESNHSSLYTKIDNFVKRNPQFNIPM